MQDGMDGQSGHAGQAQSVRKAAGAGTGTGTGAGAGVLGEEKEGAPLRQLCAVLRKHVQVKRSEPVVTSLDFLIPAAFMCLLIITKVMSNEYNSPNVAYYCGQTQPFWYAPSSMEKKTVGPETIHVPTEGIRNLTSCFHMPENCTADHYYRQKIAFEEPYTGETFVFYDKYGYTKAGDQYPWYSYTVADESSFYDDSAAAFGNYTTLFNPSLPVHKILANMASNNALFALAPNEKGNAQLDQAVADFADALRAQAHTASIGDIVTQFPSEQDINDYIEDHDYNDDGYKLGKIGMAIIFNEADNATEQWNYAIRLNFSEHWEHDPDQVSCLYYGTDFMTLKDGCLYTYTIPSTKFDTDDLELPQIMDYVYGYGYSGFLALQKFVDLFIMSKTPAVGAQPVYINSSMSLMAVESYDTDNFSQAAGEVLTIMYMLIFIYPFARMLGGLVFDKEAGLREGMRMMGLHNFSYNTAWLIVLTVQMALICLLITGVASTTVYANSAFGVIFLYFFAFGMSSIGLAFLFATTFQKSRTASVVGTVLYFCLFLPYYAVMDEQYTHAIKVSTCILSPACFALGADVITDFETGLVGVHYDNLNDDQRNFKISYCITMMFFDFALYSAVAWYLDKLLPSEYGARGTSWLTPFSSARAEVTVAADDAKKRLISSELDYGPEFEERQQTNGRNQNHSVEDDNHDDPADDAERATQAVEWSHHTARRTTVEPVDDALRRQITENRAVVVRRLRKVWETESGTDVVAIHNLNLNLYEGQICVLLGHNGAGKTTMLSMLTGMTDVTRGDALVRGHQLTRDLPQIRQFLGVCPQHNLIVPELTVRQHFELFAEVKHVPAERQADEVEKYLHEVGLVDKADIRADTLSHGTQRKLCIGLALLGDSRFIVLDEPSSGMDPVARRQCWNLLQRNKEGRIIVISTHHMDEADVLGDRIAILADGHLRCVGSPLFLKQHYGVGYTLVLVHPRMQSVEQERCVVDTVMRFVPDAEQTQSRGAQSSFRLPFEAAGRFSQLLDSLGQLRDQGFLDTFGLTVTTLEEVFVRAGRNAEDPDERQRMRQSIDYLYEKRESMSRVLDHTSADKGGELLADANTADFGRGTTDLETGNLNPATSENPTKQLLSPDDHTPKATTANGHTNGHAGNGHTNGHSTISGDQDDKEAPAEWWETWIVVPAKVFYLHFIALLLKRFYASLRDRKAFACQLLLPTVLVVIGLCLTLLQPSFQQPNLLLSGTNYNTDLVSSKRNFVPFDAQSADAELLRAKFNGNDLDAVAVNVTQEPDQFEGCANGPEQLRDMANFVVADVGTEHEDGSSRYGGIVAAGTLHTLAYNVFVNGSAVHGPGIYANLMHNALYQELTGNAQAQIKAHNHPLPSTYKEKNIEATINAFEAATYFAIAACFFPAALAAFIVKEREVKAKHQQLVSGVSIPAYWLSTYVWDVFTYMIPAALMVMFLHAFDIEPYTKKVAVGATILLFVLYGFAMPPFTYLITFFFRDHSLAQNAALFANFLTGLCLMTLSFILTNMDEPVETNYKLRWFYRIFPAFDLGDGLIQIATCYDGKNCPLLKSSGYSYTDFGHIYDWKVMGAHFTYLGVAAPVYLILCIGIDMAINDPRVTKHVAAWQAYFSGVKSELLTDNLLDHGRHSSVQVTETTSGPAGERRLSSTTSRNGVDLDVLEEDRRIQAGETADDLLLLRRLRKVFETPHGPLVAVRSLTFGVQRRQCFGLLGNNGAGKSTAINMLSGELLPSSGTADVGGASILSNPTQVRRKLGYCPQENPLLEYLTAREHLYLYARLKCVPADELEDMAQRHLKELDLLPVADKVAKEMSMGNKRKLSVAIALMADPEVLVLDEPGTGLDPVTRRFMWDVITRVALSPSSSSASAGFGPAHAGQPGCAVLLTTHSMEEAEALCTHIGVMVNGELKCIGTPQHLVAKFGGGFELVVKYPFSDWVVEDENANQPLLAFLEEHFAGYELLDKPSPYTIHFRLPDQEGVELGHIFDLFERNKAALRIAHYAVAQYSLESVFQHLAANLQENSTPSMSQASST